MPQQNSSLCSISFMMHESPTAMVDFWILSISHLHVKMIYNILPSRFCVRQIWVFANVLTVHAIFKSCGFPNACRPTLGILSSNKSRLSPSKFIFTRNPLSAGYGRTVLAPSKRQTPFPYKTSRFAIHYIRPIIKYLQIGHDRFLLNPSRLTVHKTKLYL